MGSLEECLKFANGNPASFLATVEGDQPHVRGMLLWFADKSGFYYHTGTTKNVCRQLQKNPKAEICFYAPAPAEQGGGRMLRVTGTAEFLQDGALSRRLLSERPWLLAVVPGKVEDLLAIFRIRDGEAWFWTIADNMREAAIPRYRF
jgi:uncharacterized pyridoxamine 5'-phosphate oxidase family protein